MLTRYMESEARRPSDKHQPQHSMAKHTGHTAHKVKLWKWRTRLRTCRQIMLNWMSCIPMSFQHYFSHYRTMGRRNDECNGDKILETCRWIEQIIILSDRIYFQIYRHFQRKVIALSQMSNSDCERTRQFTKQFQHSEITWSWKAKAHIITNS